MFCNSICKCDLFESNTKAIRVYKICGQQTYWHWPVLSPQFMTLTELPSLTLSLSLFSTLYSSNYKYKSIYFSLSYRQSTPASLLAICFTLPYLYTKFILTMLLPFTLICVSFSFLTFCHSLPISPAHSTQSIKLLNSIFIQYSWNSLFLPIPSEILHFPFLMKASLVHQFMYNISLFMFWQVIIICFSCFILESC